MTTEQATKYLGLNKRRLEVLRSQGGGPVYAKLGRNVRYRRSDLDAWVDAHIVGHSAEANMKGLNI